MKTTDEQVQEVLVNDEELQQQEKPLSEEIPMVLFSSSPNVVNLTLEAQGVLLYNGEKG